MYYWSIDLCVLGLVPSVSQESVCMLCESLSPSFISLVWNEQYIAGLGTRSWLVQYYRVVSILSLFKPQYATYNKILGERNVHRRPCGWGVHIVCTLYYPEGYEHRYNNSQNLQSNTKNVKAWDMFQDALVKNTSDLSHDTQVNSTSTILLIMIVTVFGRLIIFHWINPQPQWPCLQLG